jgi:hypothetical protein
MKSECPIYTGSKAGRKAIIHQPCFAATCIQPALLKKTGAGKTPSPSIILCYNNVYVDTKLRY